LHNIKTFSFGQADILDERIFNTIKSARPSRFEKRCRQTFPLCRVKRRHRK